MKVHWQRTGKGVDDEIVSFDLGSAAGRTQLLTDIAEAGRQQRQMSASMICKNKVLSEAALMSQGPRSPHHWIFPILH
jgi:hypothetical protein